MDGPIERTRYSFWVDQPPERVIRALVDFGPDRDRVWRETSHPAVYRLHWRREYAAEVTEGVPFAWSRERYDWSQPGSVLLTQLESNVARNGTIRYTVTPGGDGSWIICERYREFCGMRGLLAGTLMILVGRSLLQRQLRAGLRRLSRG